MAFYGEYREIARPDRVVFTEIFEPFPDAESVVAQVVAARHCRDLVLGVSRVG